jgi:hypothetical protein
MTAGPHAIFLNMYFFPQTFLLLFSLDVNFGKFGYVPGVSLVVMQWSVIYWLVIAAGRCFYRWAAAKVCLFLLPHPFVLIAVNDNITATASSSLTSSPPLCIPLFSSANVSHLTALSFSHKFTFLTSRFLLTIVGAHMCLACWIVVQVCLFL